MKGKLINWDEVFKLVSRSRQGFNAFCATFDLLGIRSMMKNNPDEAKARLNDLQQGFGDALIFFPGGQDYRVCFAADSLFIVKELLPEDNWIEHWPSFNGHLFAIASLLHDLETNIGNPGLRVIISYGHLLQLSEPDSWRDKLISEYTENWLVLTGASDALIKCDEAERLGSKGGFVGGYCWHEEPDKEYSYLGTPLFKMQIEYNQQPNLYPDFYKEIRSKAVKMVKLRKENT